MMCMKMTSSATCILACIFFQFQKSDSIYPCKIHVEFMYPYSIHYIVDTCGYHLPNIYVSDEPVAELGNVLSKSSEYVASI